MKKKHSTTKLKESNKYIKFDIPDMCRRCQDKCNILEALSIFEVYPDPDLVDMYCSCNFNNKTMRNTK